MAPESFDDGVLELIEIERARIGHDIHDTLLPLIFGASASLQGLLQQDSDVQQASSQPTGADRFERKRLIQIADWLGQALEVGRKVLVEVYPPELERQDWSDAVRGTLSRIIDRSCDITWDIDLAVNGQSQKVLSAAYRIVIEAVRNAIRHGKATKIDVTVKHEADAWSITVSDNGAGFDVSEIPYDSFGVRSMMGRAKLSGGTCSVESKKGGPTCVRFQWDASIA